MACHLRLTPDEYRAVVSACDGLPLAGSYRAFQKRLADALRERQPGLAGRVAEFGTGQVRALREHLQGRAGAQPAEADFRLTWREWQAVSHAAAAFCLHEAGLLGFRPFLLRQLGACCPALAGKLARLDECQQAELYRRVRSGRRWCP